MPLFDVATGSTLGVLLGMRHALEPDHLAAVSTLMSESRSSRRAAMLGLFWGFGHTIALVAVGAVLVLLRSEMPPKVADLFEFFVALMLIGLGLRAIVRAARQGPAGPAAAHQHGPLVHEHHGVADHVHVGHFTLARRPLLIGLVHGLAGSGALTALVLAELPTVATRIVYMVLFGLGSSVGMAALSGLLGWPLAQMGHQSRAFRALSMAVGCLSTALGVFWGAPLLSRLLQ
jgi:ABC-type nickel/cobalt efflux system permease component RcnA